MKILCISDSEQNELYEGWTDEEAEKLKDVGLVLSAGDLDPDYLEFIETMLNVPLLYVRGNHDSRYDEEPPEGCLDIDDKVVYLAVGDDGVADVCESVTQGIQGRKLMPADRTALLKGMRSSADTAGSSETPFVLKIAGLGGSMGTETEGELYPEEDQFTESEMASRCGQVGRKILDLTIQDKLLSGFSVSDSAPLDILLTHSPCFGHGDLEDPAHRGFSCFNRLLEKWKPSYHIYGHVHMEYGRFDRVSTHPSGTTEINVSGMYMLDL